MDSSLYYAAALTCVAGVIIFLLYHFNTRPDNGLPPGPRSLPIIGNLHMLGKLPHRNFYDMAKKYGPIMFLRLGNVPAVVISSPEAVKLFLKTHGNVFSDRPKTQAFQQMFSGEEGLAFSMYGPHWKKVWKICSVELLSPTRMEMDRQMRKDAVERVVELFKRSAVAGTAVNVSAKVRELIEDMSCTMILGCGTKDTFDLKPLIQEALHLGGLFNLADYIPLLAPFDLRGLSRRMKAVRAAIEKALEDIIEDHEHNRNNYEGEADFVDILLSMMNNNNMGEDDDQVLDRRIVKAILFDMVAASYETAGVAIEWTLSELIKNPRTMTCLQDELESVVGLDRIVEEEDIKNLGYLEMVVKENFRLHPTSTLLLPHASSEEVVVNGYRIPKGCHLFVNTWGMGRDPTIWTDHKYGVDEFCPEKFLDGNTEFMGRDFRLLSFGAGRRVCPGMSLGLREIHLVVAQLVHCFKWELPYFESPTDLDMTEGNGITNARTNNLVLRPTYRLLV